MGVKIKLACGLKFTIISSSNYSSIFFICIVVAEAVDSLD